MRKPVVLFLAALFLVIGAVVTTQADVPPIINYQGFLTKTVGPNQVPVNQPRDFRFSVWTEAPLTQGTEIWAEEHDCVKVDNGVFSVLLGAAVPLSETVFEGPDRWLQIEVRDCPDNTWDNPQDPRTRLTTVPYAFRVATVDSATGGTIKGDVEIKDGKLGIGTNNPLAPLSLGLNQLNFDPFDTHADYDWPGLASDPSTIKSLGSIVIDFDVNGLDAQIFAIAHNHGEELFRINNAGRVGIGRPNPQNKLDVDGTVEMTGFKMSTSPSLNHVLTSDGAGVGTWRDPASFDFGDGDWTFDSPPNINVLFTMDDWGIARKGNKLFGIHDSTHTNFGVADTTGRDGQDVKYATVSGGLENAASGEAATVGGGRWNKASASHSTVGGGQINHATNSSATVGGGQANKASGSVATVGGGNANTASGHTATVGGGGGNTAIGNNATVGGGSSNTASGICATVPGGSLNEAVGDYSFAAGRKAEANHNGSFVWADGTGTAFTSTAANQFLIRASGGVGIGTTTPRAKLVVHDDSLPALFVESDNPSPGAYGYFAVATVDGLWSNQAMAGDVILSTGCDASGNLIIQNRSWDDSVAIIFSHGPCNWDSEKMRIQRNGNVGIGVNDPSEILDVLGTARLRTMPGGPGTNVVVDGNGVLTKGTSSRRYKTNIRELDVDAEKVFELNPVRFQWKSTGDEDIGLIAEEVDEVISDLVIYDSDGRPEAVKYDRVAIYLLEVLKEQQREINELKATVDRLVEDQLAVRE